MLEKVVLRVEEKVLQEKILCGESVLYDDLREHGVTITFGMYGDRLSENDESDILYITDSENEYHTLRKLGRYILPYRHEENMKADFAGALYVIEQIEEVGFETIDMAYRRLAGLP